MGVNPPMPGEMEDPATLDALLVWLGQGQYDGATRYEEIRRRLIYLFTCRGCHTPEDLADETLDRTALAINKPGFQYQGDPVAYLHGVAQNILHEWLRKQRRFIQEPISGDVADKRSWRVEQSDREILSSCLENCLMKLQPEKRQVLLRYYQNDKGAKIRDRKDLAGEVGSNALRIQLFRLRKQVRHCVERCVRQHEM
jgi:DNA-directed RNA polymerase specialized sigma24 family protein